MKMSPMHIFKLPMTSTAKGGRVMSVWSSASMVKGITLSQRSNMEMLKISSRHLERLSHPDGIVQHVKETDQTIPVKKQ